MTYSAIYEGSIGHRRFEPVPHHFNYRLFMLYLDLDELETLFQPHPCWSVDRPNLASFRRDDHLGDRAQPLASAVRTLVAERTGVPPTGPIRLLTHLRYFGHCFNPVSFYYCFDAEDQHLETIVAEINNTPWHEQYCYVLPDAMNEDRRTEWKRYRFPKAFHVSPFMGMQQDYDWRFSAPDDRLHVHMENREEGAKHFDATLEMKRRPLDATQLRRVLWRHPFMTVEVVAKIYWQALRLRLKGTPFFAHPHKQQTLLGESHV